ncbi:5-bromo-4-chloroindolyl phosphate hydrolysis family protein [Pisciglobus halotolerans]|uniref:5-bromo-4-chloroindolyl phosphate hydrolysis protein n=1 Tax=Pisciglobus halotolerans TaxID=745365 RepID=A0A1I3BWK3_9LACT|nr:5-bromo-4-chloroindolyl phosphate hydrolysis family protein [Pisciglobus halotolerans]SFH66426.1 5-bromo-4-chloroindolyl phosphate hydrolysis protein [Pisciglobus halotolerans]
MDKLLKNLKDIISYTFTSVTTILIFLILLFLFSFDFWVSLIISLGIGSFLFYKNEQKQTVRKGQRLGKVSSEKEAFYKSKGLSKEETKFFRETMQTAKINILQLEKNMHASTKLTAIEKRNNTIHLAKELFKAIVSEPNRLHEVDKFLYVHLPSLRDLTSKYIEVDQHEVKQKSTFDVLNKSAQTIDEMCNQIAQDYVSFKSDEVEDMELEVELAKKMMTRDNGDSNEIQQEEL